jgi:hypothetical protein
MSACNDETSGKKSRVRDRCQRVEEAQDESTREVRSTVSRTALQAACEQEARKQEAIGSLGARTKGKCSALKANIW